VTNVERPNEEREDELRIDVLRTVETHGRRILLFAGAAAALAVLWLAVGQLRQPVTRTAAVEFQPAFEGAAAGEYPNGLSFAVSDITAASIVDPVYDANGIDRYCGRDLFRSGFFVEQQSAEYRLLEGEYQAKLANPRLAAADSERLQNEYRVRRSTIPQQYRLVFNAAGPCQSIPKTVLAKSLNDVLQGWAEQSETRRGVLKLQVQVLTPSVLDVGLSNEASRLIRADLVRSALRRLIANIRVVEERPGASLVRAGESRTTLAEIRGKFEDLIQARLDPLVVMAGRGLGAESLAWVDEALAAARQEKDLAEGRVQAYLAALREYSGTAAAGLSAAGQRAPSAGPPEIQTQIDRSFIDTILSMSEANTTFRQDLTRGMVEADVAAAESRARAAYYEHLAASLRRPGGGTLSVAEVDQKLEEIVRDGKALAAQFNELYDEWSAVSLRPAAGMYRVSEPVRDESVRTGNLVLLPLVAGAVFAIALIAALLLFLTRDHYAEWRMRRLARSRA
jgi:hypothetical protein